MDNVTNVRSDEDTVFNHGEVRLSESQYRLPMPCLHGNQLCKKK